MADDDNFDIDIYGNGDGDDFSHENTSVVEKVKKDDDSDLTLHDDPAPVKNIKENAKVEPEPDQDHRTDNHTTTASPKGVKNESHETQKIASSDETARDHMTIPKQPPQKQGIKRKGGADDRPVPDGATSALHIMDMNWWTTDDDVRGWVNQAECEDELKDITFNEHKVNGKSKGQVFVEFTSAQAAVMVKEKIESFGEGQQYARKHQVSFTSPHANPFKTLPKDTPARGDNRGRERDNRSVSSNFTNSSIGQNNNSMGYQGMNNMGRGGFNQNRGGFNNRGNQMNGIGNFGNRNFSGAMPNQGFQTPMGGFQAAPMGNMGQFGGGFHRGGMMGGMRGGPNRGGRGGVGMMSGGMPMGGMGMGMGMPGQMGGMGGMNMGQMGGMQGMPEVNSISLGVSRGMSPATAVLVQQHRAGAPVIPGPYRGPFHFDTKQIPSYVAQPIKGLYNSPVEPESGSQFPCNTTHEDSLMDRPEPSHRPDVTLNNPESHHRRLKSVRAEAYNRRFGDRPVSPFHHSSRGNRLNREHNGVGQVGFQGNQAHFNPAFFGQGQQNAGNDYLNPHGAKRPRPE